MRLRDRITLLATGTVAVTILLASVACYLAMRAELRGQVDESLRTQASAGERVIRRLGLAVPQNRIPVPRDPPQGIGVAQILGDDGRVVVSLPRSARIPVTAQDRAIARGDAPARFSDRDAGGTHLRVLTTPVAGGAIQLTRSLASTDRTLSRLRLVLALLLLAGSAFAFVVSRLFARRVAAPLGEVGRAADHITQTGDLSRRIDVTGDDEVAEMATRFNAMLDRLEASSAALAASAGAQRQLVADASHELRTPITSLRTNIEVLLEPDELGDRDRSELLADLRDQTEEISGLIDDVIESARGDHTVGPTEDVRLDVVVGEAARRIERRHEGMRFELDTRPAIVHGARDRIGRAVANLLDNAAKHSPPGAAAEVMVADGVLEVTDHGPGVPDAEKPHVFDRFYSGGGARSGYGLGLAIVKQAADAHGGSVEVADAPGGGAVFRLRLPAGARDDAVSSGPRS